MDDQKIVDLSKRRADDRMKRRKDTLSRFKPSPSLIAWGVLLTVAVVGYIWSGASSRFEKAPPAGVTN